MTLVFLGFGRFQVSETAIKQTQNLKLMREMQSTSQTDPKQPIRFRFFRSVQKDEILLMSRMVFLHVFEHRTASVLTTHMNEI